MGQATRTVLKTTLIYLVLVVPVVAVIGLFGGGATIQVLVGSLVVLVVLAVPSAIASGLVALIPMHSGAGRVARGVVAAIAAGACGYLVAGAYVAGLDLGPYAASAANHQRTMSFLVGALLMVVGLLTGLLVEPRRGDQATP
jgi:hypothetical protein